MSLWFFEGVAGSGKTTSLLRVLSDRVEASALGDEQRVLALTFMHGSRRRLEARLRVLRGLLGRFDCVTIDSFAWQLVRRWRSHALNRWGQACLDETDFDGTCERAAELMRTPLIGAWVARRYPITLVDELQDCRTWRLRMVQQFASESECYVAADDFQDLSDPPSDEAVVWARRSGSAETLQLVHRTSRSGLLQAAKVLRAGEAPANGAGFRLLRAKNPNVGAMFVARNLTWWWNGRGTDIALLTPTSRSSSLFIDRLFARLAEKSFEKNGKRFGPFDVPWEDPEPDDPGGIVKALGLNEEGRVVLDQVAQLSQGVLGHELCEWADAQRRLLGRVEFKAAEIRHQLARARHRARAHYYVASRPVRAMTIHQAKNREFDSVIVLWPFEIPSGTERRRRLLYNAITRAKRQAVVVVQDPEGDVMAHPPFASDTSRAP